MQLWTVHSELQSSREIFTKKTTEQSRHLAWVNAAIISMVSWIVTLETNLRFILVVVGIIIVD